MINAELAPKARTTWITIYYSSFVDVVYTPDSNYSTKGSEGTLNDSENTISRPEIPLNYGSFWEHKI